jgi:hypothetical protein
VQICERYVLIRRAIAGEIVSRKETGRTAELEANLKRERHVREAVTNGRAPVHYHDCQCANAAIDPSGRLIS